MKTYSEKLKDPRWQKKRLTILNRDQFMCRGCYDSESTLNVHHKYYNNCDPWDMPDMALVTLCESCHEQETKLQKIAISDLQKSISNAGGLSYEMIMLSCAFDHASNHQLDDVDWLILLTHIQNLLESRIDFCNVFVIVDPNDKEQKKIRKGSEMWRKLVNAHYRRISKKAQ